MSIIRHPELREYENVIACLIEVRGKSYYSPEYYDPQWLANNIELFAAFDENGVLEGVAGLSKGLFNDNQTTGCLLTIKNAFAGCGEARVLIEHFTEVLKKRNARSVKGQVVTVHPGVQRTVERLGWIPTGFLHGARHGKNSLVLYTANLSKKDTGTLYIHNDIAFLAGKMYDELGVKADIRKNGNPGKTRISRKHDAHNSVCYIHILECGNDKLTLEEQAIVALNLGDQSAISGYEALRSAGYRFCGFDPLGQYEHAIFYSGDEPAFIELTERAEALKREVDLV